MFVGSVAVGKEVELKAWVKIRVVVIVSVDFILMLIGLVFVVEKVF